MEDKKVYKERKTFKNDVELMRTMNKKERREHIWEYYRVYIISAIVFVLVVGNLVNTIFINPAKKSGANLTFYGEIVSNEFIEAIQPDLNEKFIDEIDREKYEFGIQNFYFVKEDAQLNMANTQKFMAIVSVRELDVIIANESYFNELVGRGMFLEVKDVFSPEVIEKNRDDIVSGRVVLENGDLKGKETVLDEEKQYGIKIGENSYLQEAGNNQKDLVIGVIINTKDVEKAKSIADYIMEFKKY